ncbi:hypothetical protein N7G274_009072 [Stereocaulon virgatum]|uniref:Uncharacterized protein n=1 Tax=Stereocaulon virgatum TaxID=373712 RepID=A0ABR3ZY50_9LECA
MDPYFRIHARFDALETKDLWPCRGWNPGIYLHMLGRFGAMAPCFRLLILKESCRNNNSETILGVIVNHWQNHNGGRQIATQQRDDHQRRFFSTTAVQTR